MKYKIIYTASALITLLFLGCFRAAEKEVTGTDHSRAPLGFPPIPFPEDNPYSKEKAELGRLLFYERILSRDSSIASCSHCMKPQYSFADNVRHSRGYGLEAEKRNTMSLVNVAYRDILFWDGRGSRIEGPAYRSIWLPMIFGADTNIISERLANHSEYPALFKSAFGRDARPSAYLISKAIATYVRTIVSGNSNYDKYINGDKSALNDSELRGMKLFFSEKTSCSVCHSGFMFTDQKFHSTGLSGHYFDRGRFYQTDDQMDRGKFITPTLRNIELTGPYMHDGYIKSLEEVISHYNNGGKPFYNKDSLIRPLYLSPDEINDIIAFLKSLTDNDFLNNPWFKKPSDN